MKEMKKRGPKTKKSVTKVQSELAETPVVAENTTVQVKKPMGRRTPLYEQQALGIKEKPGFVRYQVLERPGEVERFMRAGWRPVHGDDLDLRDSRVQHDSQLGSVIRQVVNRKPGASANTAIWMEIEEEYYKEDQAAKDKRNAEASAALNPRNIARSNPDVYYTGSLDFEKIKK